MVAPVTSAVPWVGATASVSEVVGPPLRLSGTFVAAALKPTLSVLLPACGRASATLMDRFSVTPNEPPAALVVLSTARIAKWNVPTVVGVPLISPLASSVNPVGRVPPRKLKV